MGFCTAPNEQCIIVVLPTQRKMSVQKPIPSTEGQSYMEEREMLTSEQSSQQICLI